MRPKLTGENLQPFFAVIESARDRGERITASGARLIGRCPHIAPEAWSHLIFAPLARAEVERLEQRVRKPVPDDYKDFLLIANGISVFSDALSIYGLGQAVGTGEELAWQPYDVTNPNTLERPRDAKANHFFIGIYMWDGSQLYMDSDGPTVYRCARDTVAPLNEWPSLADMLNAESQRLTGLFDAQGRELDLETPTIPRADR